MKTKFLVSAIAFSLSLSGCANMDDKTASAATGSVIGCAGGVLIAKIAGGNPTAGCAAGAMVGGLIGFEKARHDEIAAAEKARQEAVSAISNTKGVRAGEVKTVEITATDKSTRETKKFQAFESVDIDLPLSTKGTPEYDAAMGKIKKLAEKIADERGSSEIELAVTPADAKLKKIALRSDVVKTGAGNTITVSKVANKKLSRGLERITVRAGGIKTTEV